MNNDYDEEKEIKAYYDAVMLMSVEDIIEWAEKHVMSTNVIMHSVYSDEFPVNLSVAESILFGGYSELRQTVEYLTQWIKSNISTGDSVDLDIDDAL